MNGLQQAVRMPHNLEPALVRGCGEAIVFTLCSYQCPCASRFGPVSQNAVTNASFLVSRASDPVAGQEHAAPVVIGTTELCARLGVFGRAACSLETWASDVQLIEKFQ